MGAYLSEPLTTKDSSDEANDVLGTGSSSMQGWRISQEDAHNCILNFDENTSFFAVYDGHGGSEVAQYCSMHLPTFLKTLSSYKSKNFEQALKDAFIGFDATLLEDKIIEELKKLSDKTNGEEAVDDDEDEEEDDNVDDLCKEACMPLNEVLQMYKKDKKNPALNKIKEGNCSKPLSPFLKGKRKGLLSEEASDEAGPSSSNADASPSGSSSAEADVSSDKKTGIPDAADSTVSSSSNKTDETLQKPESSSTSDATVAEQDDEISDTDGIVPVKITKEECAPDSSSSSKPDEEAKPNVEQVKSSTPTVNGDPAESGNKSTVSSSSAANQENGVVSSNTSAGSSGNSDIAGSSAASKSGAKVVSSSPGSSTSSPAVASNGPNAVDDDSEEDDTDTDEEFPPVADANETSSTEDGEEDPYCEEASEEDEEDDDLEYNEDEEEYMNEADEAFMNNITDEPGKDSGCTAVVALLHDKELFVANAGDSRCVVCRDGKALEMSFDHKPEDQIEFDRIQKAGGRVTLDGRVNGGLNLSRAIGDHGYKMNKKLPPEEQMISALPDIKQITIGPTDDFMVLACDGIWNFMTSDDVVEFVQERIRDPTKKLSEICEEMFDYCLAPHTKGDGTGCDNMTAIIVQFKPNFTGSASRKRAASTESEITEDCKKAKTEAGASSTTGGKGSSCKTTTTSSFDEKEAAAAVASIESSSPMDSSDNTASSST
ncbi:probable protein phosphatase CG10417 [Topomyia yanbarensis]|uniref:probable protein phosphatase CG10417 n=1 Tax=Topomyia yanbarensis TaxID=2498891 RepID=UPI00273A9BB6|nr:probable protein phosphatase CG10417 [Topomyia yanbarensis]